MRNQMRYFEYGIGKLIWVNVDIFLQICVRFFRKFNKNKTNLPKKKDGQLKK